MTSILTLEITLMPSVEGPGEDGKYTPVCTIISSSPRFNYICRSKNRTYTKDEAEFIARDLVEEEVKTTEGAIDSASEYFYLAHTGDKYTRYEWTGGSLPATDEIEEEENIVDTN